MLIESLIDYRKRKGHDITVVFDGWKTGEGQEGRSVVGGVQVIYSRIGEKADAVIQRIISMAKRQCIVVSSDRDIADYAWSAGSVPATAEAFLRALARKAMANGGSEEEDDEEIGPLRKGNPRQLSKKEKAIARALSKL